MGLRELSLLTGAMTSTEHVMRTVVYTKALACAVTGGVLFSFSSFVMPGLRALPAPAAVSAMQAINLAAPKSWLLLPLLGSAVGSLAVGVYAALSAPSGRGWLLVGAVAGMSSMVITAGYSIPHNDVLAGWEPGAASTATWLRWSAEWTRWNSARTVAAVVAAVALTVGALTGAGVEAARGSR